MTARLGLFGVDHPLFGAVTAETGPGGRSGVAIAAGGDPASIRWETKGDPSVPNEDAVCVVEDGERVLLAVADSHFGHRASHAAIGRVLDERVPPLGPAQLERLVDAIADAARDVEDGSETTLSIAVLERRTGVGFGVTFGDSTIATIRADGVDLWSPRRSDFVRPGHPGTFAGAGRRFALSVPRGALLVAFTDGVDGCCGTAGPSIGSAELLDLGERVGFAAATFAARLTELALEGVHGRSGGRDNVAVAAAAC